eukprot:3357984-Rhodomonas_salina.1
MSDSEIVLRASRPLLQAPSGQVSAYRYLPTCVQHDVRYGHSVWSNKCRGTAMSCTAIVFGSKDS